MKGMDCRMNGCVTGAVNGTGGVRSEICRQMVAVLMSVALFLGAGLTGTLAQDTTAPSQEQTRDVRTRMAEKAMATILQDLDEMVVNERLGCYMECDTSDVGRYGFGFDEAWFVGSSGDQDDDMPYEYFHYYVKTQTATNAMGVPYVRFDLHRARCIMAVFDQYGTYAFEKGQTEWWDRSAVRSVYWDDQVLLENVVQFDIYCMGKDGDYWMGQGDSSGDPVFNSTFRYRVSTDFGPVAVSNVPPAFVQVHVQVTTSEAAMEGGMAMASGSTVLEKEGREIMVRNAETYSIVAEPITGAAQLWYPANHYMD